jgi:choline dehydrogenase-like flavoprotein
LLYDLTGRGNVTGDAHFIVIGAGTVGLVTAVRLAERTGLKVICLESGGYHQESDIHPLNEVVQNATVYQGAANGRFRCLGGTSTRWGGALIPFQASDLSEAEWPIGIEELTPYIPELETLFGLKPGPYSDPNFPFALGPNHVNRLAKWPPFRNRNVAHLLDAQVKTNPNLSVWLNAHVTSIDNKEDTVEIYAQSFGGDTIFIKGRKLIISAGAIETTRLSLMMFKNKNDNLDQQPESLGKYFSDHISVEVGEIHNPSRKALNEIIGFRFESGGIMRNIRFEMSPNTPARAYILPSFTHIGFSSDRRGGFDILREIFQRFQRRTLPSLRLTTELFANAPWLLRALWWRFFKGRLLFPEKCRLLIHIVVEQEAISENFIQLNMNKEDCFGQPLAEISWKITESDKENAVNSANLFKETWEMSGLSKLGEFRIFDHEKIWDNVDNSGGIYHPTGSTKMGEHAGEAVVDRDLYLFGVSNIQLLATSVLPTGGGANPTMTLLLLALRCVDQHQDALRIH